MDIRTLLAEPSAAEREAIDGVLGPPTSAWDGGVFQNRDGHVAYGGHSARNRRHLLLPALHAAQDTTGAITRGALGYISERLTVPPAEAYGVATFYALFDTDGNGGPKSHVCDDIVCAGRVGAGSSGFFSPCLGQCDTGRGVLDHTPGVGYSVPDTPTFVAGPDSPYSLLSRVGEPSPTLESYISSGGYQALRRAVELGSGGVIGELERSGLRGRGGAAFPIGMKWNGLASAEGPKFVIGNGDESEPGTFKDRVLMEGDPFAVVEAMTIYAYVTGAEHGYLYVRGEYPVAEARLRAAIEAAGAAGLLGEEVAPGFSFDLEIRRGAGAYICGEETALFASIEGRRGEPRQKPPFPTQNGLFGRPTGINNVETLLASLKVVDNGAHGHAALGTSESTGLKLFSVCGDVGRPGVYEVPFGTALRELLELAKADSVSAVLLGGSAGSFVPEERLGMELSFEGAREAGATLGSGAVIVFDESTDFGPILSRIARFFREESCGQCVPCRIGTMRQEEALLRIATGQPLGSNRIEMERLEDLARVMTEASICGLGQTASSAIQSAIALGLSGAPS